MHEQIHFCTTEDGVRVAWSAMGEGPTLVKAANWLSHLEFDLESPVWRHWLRELSRDHTLIRYDERGCGLSDRDVKEFSTEAWVRDLEAVVDAAGLDRFALLGISQGGPVAIAYAVRHPERVSHLVIYGSYARGWARRNLPPDALAEHEALVTLTRAGWGRDIPAYRQIFTGLFVPEGSEEQVKWFNELQRVSASPENAVKFLRAFGEIDVTDLVDRLAVAPLILHARGDARVPFDEGRHLAAGTPGSRFVSLPSNNHVLLEHEPAWHQFLAEVRDHLGVRAKPALRTEEPAVGGEAPDGRALSSEPGFLDLERRRQMEELFEEARALPSGERQAFLEDRCSTDSELCAAVSALLRANERSAGILEATPGAASEATEKPAGLLARLRQHLSPPKGRAGLPGPAAGGRESAPADGPAELTSLVGVRVTHYVVGEGIGGGGMGVVYRAKDELLDRTVALKFLPTHLVSDSVARDRFLVEAQAAAALDHPHICTVHEIGTAPDGRMFIAMPLYEGETLRERIGRGPVAVSEAIELTLQVARGLAKAHEVGVIHRDIKPANVLVTTDGIAKIVDFGLAKLSGVELTRTGEAMGTVAYMSPEQARGEAVDERTDLWSLGVVLYEMLAGTRPFGGENGIAILHAILKREPERLGNLREELPAGLEDLVHRCLQKDPAERLASAAELAESLKALQTAPEPLRRLPGETAAPIAPGGERRRACILVSSIATYSELVERLSPDELDSISEQIGHEVARIVEEAGGVVNASSGDQVVCLFGIPLAHEDQFRRAVSAALRVHEQLAELNIGLAETWPSRSLELRTGIGTGNVVVQPAAGPEMRYRVAGRAVEVASRLAAHAGAGEILISDECQRGVAPFFETEAGQQLQSRGGMDEITPYRVIGETDVRSPFEAAQAERLTAFVGRDQELSALLEACAQAAQGDGRFVSVVGEAGTGKSRLLYEFRRALDGDRMRVLEGRCAAKASKRAFAPFVDVLRARLGGEAGHALNVDEAVDGVRSISPELERFVPHYLHLLGLESAEHELLTGLEGDQRRLAILEAISALMTVDARRRPLAVLLESWQDADSASRKMLRQLTEMVAAHPLLIVTTSRPDPRIDWGAPTYHLPIHLGPLTSDASGLLVRSVLGADDLPPELATRLHARTGGNPLFLEEMSRTLLETGALRVHAGKVRLTRPVDSLELPDTVQGVIGTRLDRLAPSTKQLLTHAAVIGREFSEAVLARTLEDPPALQEDLRAARDLGLIQQVGVLPNATYRFTHAATQEVAYEGLLRHRQKELHQTVGEAIEELSSSRLEEELDRLSFHFGRAAIWWKAVLYGQKAAERAEELSQFAEALELLDQVLDQVGRLPSREEREEIRIRILFKQERLCETLGLRERQRAIIDGLIRLLDPVGESRRLGEAHLRKGDLGTLTREFRDAGRELTEALRIGRALKDRDLERNALRSMGLLCWHQERNEEAISLQEQALAIDRQLEDAEGTMIELTNLGNLYKGIGRYEEALHHLFEASEVPEGRQGEDAAKLKQKLLYVYHNIGNIYRVLGESEKAMEYLERAVAHLGGSLQPIHSAFHLTAVANIRLEEGRIEESLELYREAISQSRKTRNADGLALSLRTLGEVLLGMARSEEALPYLVEAAKTYAPLHDREAEAGAWQAAAKCYERQEQIPDAIAAWERVRTLGERFHNERRAIEAIEALARLSGASQPERALSLYSRAIRVAEAMGDRSKQASLLNSLAILHWRGKEYDLALERYETALHIYKDLEDWVHVGLVLNSLGVTLRDLGRPEEAAASLEEALEVNRMTGERLLEAHSLSGIGELDHDAGRHDEAVARFEASLGIRRETGDRLGVGWMLYRIARSEAATGSSVAARNQIAMASEIASELSDDELGEACRSLKV